MNRNQLKYFVAAAESRSFTKAAEQFYISQTAITQQIRLLEEALGCPLFDRSTRPVSLTPAGTIFLREAKGILERMSRAQERVHDASTGLSGTLRVGYVRGYERSDLSAHIRQFHQQNSNVLITFYRCSTDALAAGLLHHEYDIIFTWDSTNLKTQEGVACRTVEKARLVVREMAEELILNLVDKGLVTDQIDLTIGYDTASLTTPGIRYTGPVTTDHYGRKVPKHAHGTRHLGRRTQSAKVILDAAMALFDRIVNPALLVRRVNIVALHILVGQEELPVPEVEQLDLFTDYAKLEQERLAEQARLERESRIQQAALSIKRKFGKNALVKGMDLQEDATAMTRNNQIGGHKA